MVGIAQLPDEGNDIEAKLTVRQGPGSFLFWATKFTKSAARRIETARQGQCQLPNAIDSANGSVGTVRSMEGGSTHYACCVLNRQITHMFRGWNRNSTYHSSSP